MRLGVLYVTIHLHQEGQLRVVACLVLILQLVVDVNQVLAVVASQADGGHTVLGCVLVAFPKPVIVDKVHAGRGFSLVGYEEFDVLSVHLSHLSLEVTQNFLNLLRNVVYQNLVFELQAAWNLGAVDEAQRPGEETECIADVAHLLCILCVDVELLGSLEPLVV